VLFFANHVIPRLLRTPRVASDPSFLFHVIGANAIPPAILALNGTRRVVVHGYVAELRPLYATMRLSVAPLRWGAGVKGKVNTAHSFGVPVVATPMAVEGMHVVEGEHVLLGETSEELAAAILQGYYNSTLWRRLAAHGPKLVARRFSASRAGTGSGR